MYQQIIRINLNTIIAGLTIFLGSCRVKSETEIFLIPNNYEGVVIVLFDQPNGVQEIYFENKRLYDIPQNGILATKFPKTTHGRIKQIFYYKDKNGNKITELHPYSIDKVDEHKNFIISGEYGNFTNKLYDSGSNKYPVQYRLLTIGKIKDKDSLQILANRFLDKLIHSY